MKALHHARAPLPAEQLSARWARLHQRAAFAFSTSEAHYLRAVALALDDDLLALLLLKKLRIATERQPSELHGVVTKNSIVGFSFGGGSGIGRLAHPSCCEPGSLSIASHVGAGLVGMRRGQTILWPDGQGELRPLSVDTVERAGGKDAEAVGAGPTIRGRDMAFGATGAPEAAERRIRDQRRISRNRG